MGRYKRVLIKLSGQAVSGDGDATFDASALEHLATEILSVHQTGVNVAVVIGGGNVFRGRDSGSWGIDRIEADNIGMLGTVINSLLLRGKLNSLTGQRVRVMTAIPINSIAEPYVRLRAVNHLSKGEILIFACGNGQPFQTTDYPAVQRALEVDCDALLVGKHGVDGIYDSDPKKNVDARRFETISYGEVIDRRLEVMDHGAFVLAQQHRLPLHVFDVDQSGIMAAICRGEHHGTQVVNELDTV
ncbi:MAG TPA: UMP kinase [Mycobacteriales bacterium]|nr:UMP kinase [Mycobacteriales bacterium]